MHCPVIEPSLLQVRSPASVQVDVGISWVSALATLILVPSDIYHAMQARHASWLHTSEQYANLPSVCNAIESIRIAPHHSCNKVPCWQLWRGYHIARTAAKSA